MPTSTTTPAIALRVSQDLSARSNVLASYLVRLAPTTAPVTEGWTADPTVYNNQRVTRAVAADADDVLTRLYDLGIEQRLVVIASPDPDSDGAVLRVGLRHPGFARDVTDVVIAGVR